MTKVEFLNDSCQLWPGTFGPELPYVLIMTQLIGPKTLNLEYAWICLEKACQQIVRMEDVILNIFCLLTLSCGREMTHVGLVVCGFN